MELAAAIRESLAGLEPVSIELFDESGRHAGHRGAESGGGHFRFAIVSTRFTGMNKLARHRMIYAALGALMQSEIHALAINARTPDEL